MIYMHGILLGIKFVLEQICLHRQYGFSFDCNSWLNTYTLLIYGSHTSCIHHHHHPDFLLCIDDSKPKRWVKRVCTKNTVVVHSVTNRSVHFWHEMQLIWYESVGEAQMQGLAVFLYSLLKFRIRWEQRIAFLPYAYIESFCSIFKMVPMPFLWAQSRD